MSLTILEVLQNAEINLGETSIPMQRIIGIGQLRNAIKLLNSGKEVGDDFNEEDL